MVNVFSKAIEREKSRSCHIKGYGENNVVITEYGALYRNCEKKPFEVEDYGFHEKNNLQLEVEDSCAIIA